MLKDLIRFPGILKSTKRFTKYWQNRHTEKGFDWKTAYLDGWQHPHRYMIVEILKKFKWHSLLEIGCASGPNLHLIKQAFPQSKLGGMDVSKEAIKVASQNLHKDIHLDVGSAYEGFLSDNSCDVILTDMTLIYVDDIKRALKEFKRLSGRAVVLCEFHSKSWWKRLALRLATGYRARDYKTLLEKEGFWDINLYKIPEQLWPGGEPQRSYGYVITARI